VLFPINAASIIVMSTSLRQTLLLAIGAFIFSLAFIPAIAQVPVASDSAVGPNQAAIPVSPPTTRLSLQSATDLLIKNNLSVIAARYNVDILRAQRIAAGLRPNPTMTFSATQFAIPRVFHLLSDAVRTNNENGAANTTYTMEVDQLIERGGKRELRSEQADFNRKAAEAQVQDALRQQLFQLRQAFFTAVLARENLRAAHENLDNFDRTENLLIVQVKEGYSAGVDLKRIQLQRLQFQRDLATSGQSYQQAARDVLNLIGQGDAPSAANSIQLITLSSPSQTGFPQDFIDGNLEIIPELLWIDDLRRMALANRPDIKAAELTVEAANAALKLAEAQRVRDLTVGGQYSRTGSDNTVGVVVGLPLKIGPCANAAIVQATSTRLQAEAQLRLTRTQALTDVEKAFTAYQVSRDRLRLFTSGALATANDVRRIEEIAYRDGAKGLLDYLDAQRTYNQTLVDYNQARFDFLMSLYQLEFATGSAIVK
jgi:cobalt-zinc-cadmium efflux system outer membrane protein